VVLPVRGSTGSLGKTDIAMRLWRRLALSGHCVSSLRFGPARGTAVAWLALVAKRTLFEIGGRCSFRIADYSSMWMTAQRNVLDDIPCPQRGVCQDRSCSTVGFFLPIEVRSLPGPLERGGTSVWFLGRRDRGDPPHVCGFCSANAHLELLVDGIGWVRG
jgi:hypothetical protein